VARIPGHKLKRVLWLISTVEKPRSTACRRRVAPSVVRSACQQVERARDGGGIRDEFREKRVRSEGNFLGVGAVELGDGVGMRRWQNRGQDVTAFTDQKFGGG